jgi:hypothetical protein
MKSGYLYVLIHPSNSNLYKIGQTTRPPEERLGEHNTRYNECAGQVVKETGQKWELKTYIPVPDPYWAEAVFWNATPFADIPFTSGIEIENMSWDYVQAGLDAAMKAGLRPPPGPLPDYIYAYRAWINKRLYGRGITLLSEVRSKYGKSNFKCVKGHEWRTVPNKIAEGEGCPFCGQGEMEPQAILKAINVGVINLMIHPNIPGFIKIRTKYFGIEQPQDHNCDDGWTVHRYRNVEEPVLAESIMWELLGNPQINSDLIEIDLSKAEQAFRDLHDRLVSEIALSEKVKENEQASLFKVGEP